MSTATRLNYNDVEFLFQWEYYDYEQKAYIKTDLLPNQICVYKDGKKVVSIYLHCVINPSIITLEECVRILKQYKVEGYTEHAC